MGSAYSNVLACVSNHLAEYWLELANCFSQSVGTYVKVCKIKIIYREGYFGCSF